MYTSRCHKMYLLAPTVVSRHVWTPDSFGHLSHARYLLALLDNSLTSLDIFWQVKKPPDTSKHLEILLPFINAPVTSNLWPVICDLWFVACDLWYITCTLMYSSPFLSLIALVIGWMYNNIIISLLLLQLTGKSYCVTCVGARIQAWVAVLFPTNSCWCLILKWQKHIQTVFTA